MEELDIHDRLRHAAGERTYRQLGKLTETHPESVRRYMQGQAPSVDFLTKFCQALEINASWLLTGNGPMGDKDVQPHALRSANTPDLLRALSDTVSVLISRIDRLERLVQTTEIKLRAVSAIADDASAGGAHEGCKRADSRGQGTGGARGHAAAARVGAAVARRASVDSRRDDAADGS